MWQASIWLPSVWSRLFLLHLFVPLIAGGETFSARHEDPQGAFSVKAEAIGFTCPVSGFYPIQVNIDNRTDQREFEFSTDRGCRQRIRLGAGEKSEFFLLQPLLALSDHPYFSFMRGGFDLRLFIDGRHAEKFTIHVPVSNQHGKINVWWLAPLDGASLDILAKAIAARWPDMAGDSHRHVRSSGASPPTQTIEYALKLFCAIEPRQMPSSWLGLSSGDVLACPWNTLAALPSEKRTAVLEWVENGGILLSWETPPAETVRKTWREWGGNLASVSQPLSTKNMACPLEWRVRDLLGEIHSLRLPELKDTSPAEAVSLWLREINPLPAGSFLRAAAGKQEGAASRAGSIRNNWSCINPAEIPHILKRDKWPVLIFLGIWVLVLIPIQSAWLSIKKRHAWLPLSILATSIFWMMVMTQYGLITQGFGIRAIERSWSFLDQTSHRAVVVGFSAFANGNSWERGIPIPSNGWLMPGIVPGNEWPVETPFSFHWDSPPLLTGNWLLPRTLLALNLRQSAAIHERIDIDRDETGRLRVTNRLGVPVEWMWVCDGKAGWETKTNLEPGRTVVLENETTPIPNSCAVKCWFPWTEMTAPLEGRPSYIARVARPRWSDFGFTARQEEGSQHWVAGLWTPPEPRPDPANGGAAP
ncbi:MAG: hypothetical protein PHV34_17345 [Verrucomicrobiae bacterium]|nr:hypothetical protein [Verrucomicrobiae bacterium]